MPLLAHASFIYSHTHNSMACDHHQMLAHLMSKAKIRCYDDMLAQYDMLPLPSPQGFSFNLGQDTKRPCIAHLLLSGDKATSSAHPATLNK
jgi:hypothetical protein